MPRICILIVVLISSIGLSRADQGPRAHADIAAAIKARFECSLFRLTPPTQAHWALRMYRTSGDSSYYNAILGGALLMERNLLRDLRGWNDPNYRGARGQQLLEQFSEDNRKSRSRRELFQGRSDILLMLSMLAGIKRLDELGLLSALPDEAVETAQRILETERLADFLLAEDVLQVYAAQAINYVYYLEQLGISDLREELKRSFEVVFPDEVDTSLSKLEFKDKIYGLTHFILAASDYFQKEVPKEEGLWILDYFDGHLDRILDETKEDIIAEVGLCYLLAGQDESPALARCRQALALSYDAAGGLIPSFSGSLDLETGEHRNVLAYMLLDWPERLYSGPDLGAWDEAYRLLAP